MEERETSERQEVRSDPPLVSAGRDDAADNGQTASVAGVSAAFAELYDRVIRDLHESALALTTILHEPGVSARVVETLNAAIRALDDAIRDVRTTVFAARPPDTQLLRRIHHRYLVRIEDEVVIAYADGGHDYRRVHDDTLWAHESDGTLLSSRSGTPIARRSGSTYYDTVTNIALYYETS